MIIDDLITILQRVNNCEKVLLKLEYLLENSFFSDYDGFINSIRVDKDKHREMMKSVITDCIRLIKEGK